MKAVDEAFTWAKTQNQTLKQALREDTTMTHHPDWSRVGPQLLEALKMLHNNLAEYQRINNLGGSDNHDMKIARAAIAAAKDAGE